MSEWSKSNFLGLIHMEVGGRANKTLIQKPVLNLATFLVVGGLVVFCLKVRHVCLGSGLGWALQNILNTDFKENAGDIKWR